jgi:hypothetical protein
LSTTITGPLPEIPPAAFTSAVTSAICWLKIALSVTGVMTRLRMSWKLQPVSSYGAGFATG